MQADLRIVLPGVQGGLEKPEREALLKEAAAFSPIAKSQQPRAALLTASHLDFAGRGKRRAEGFLRRWRAS